MYEQDKLGNIWVVCPILQEDVDIPTKILIHQCLMCSHHCKNKDNLWEVFIPKDVTIEDPKLEPHRYDNLKLAGRKFCIQKNRLFKNCYAKKRFCIYNTICPNKPFSGKKKLLRQRRINMYAVVTKKGDLILVDKKDIKSIDLDNIKDAYEITHAIRISTELIPYNSAGEELKDIQETFIERYGADILTEDGEATKLKHWFKDSEVNDIAFVMSGRLRPTKKIDVMSLRKFLEENKVTETVNVLKSEDSNSKMGSKKKKRKKDTTPPKEEEVATEVKIESPTPKKRKRRTKAEMEEARKQEVATPVEEKPKPKPKRKRRTKAEMEAARARGEK